MIKHLAMVGTAILATLLSLVMLWQFRTVVGYVLISLALAATARPLIVDWIKRSFMMRLVMIFAYIIIAVSLVFIVFLVGRFAIGDIQQLAQTLSVQGAWMLPPWLEGTSFQHTLVEWLPTPDKLFEALTGEQGQFVLPAVIGFTEGIGGVLSGLFLVLFLSIYWSSNQIHFERLWLSLLPSEQRKHARGIWRTIESDLGTYIRSEIIQSLLAAIFLGIGYWLLGSQYPFLLALIGALIWLIPVVGAVVAVIPPLVIGLLTSVNLSLFTALYTMVVLVVIQIWVEPRLFKRNWDNPILTLVILLAMADAFGLPGVIAAPPLSAICQILWNLLISNRLAAGAAIQVSDLKERQARLQVTIGEMSEPPPPLVTSSMERLSALLEKAEPILQASQPITKETGLPVSIKS